MIRIPSIAPVAQISFKWSGPARILVLFVLSLPGFALACETDTQAKTTNARQEQFGQLLGDWRIEQEVLQQDGSWQRVTDADWSFRWALDGCAIQDFWVQPPPGSEVPEGEVRQHGTNLRVYDPEENLWRIVWASSDAPGFTTYEASAKENGELVMMGDDPDRPGVTQRITYFDISSEGWSWKMEFSRDKENWVEVARISAKPR